MRTDDDIQRDHNNKIKKLAILTFVNIAVMSFMVFTVFKVLGCK